MSIGLYEIYRLVIYPYFGRCDGLARRLLQPKGPCAMRFVTKTIHAWLDYPVALALIALPFLLGLGTSKPLAHSQWLSMCMKPLS